MCTKFNVRYQRECLTVHSLHVAVIYAGFSGQICTTKRSAKNWLKTKQESHNIASDSS